MGDYRASIKIEFQMCGVERKADMWINWSPEDGRGSLDRRITEFFEEASLAGYAKFDEEMWDAEEENRKAAEEKRDREEYERLSAKFGPPPSLQDSEV